MLTITRRNAKLGPKVIASNDEDAADFKPDLDFTLDDILLGEEELNALLREPKADACLFVPAPRGARTALTKPRFPMLQAFKLKKAMKNCRLQVWLNGGKEPIDLDACDLSAIEIEPVEGGITRLACKVSAAKPNEKSFDKLKQHAGHEISVSVIEVQRDLDDDEE